MGYNTYFDGDFVLDKPLTIEHFALLKQLHEDDDTIKELGLESFRPKHGYLQWTVRKDRQHIGWDQNEKFYDYTAWLQFLCDHVFKPWGYKLSGTVTWQGADVEDRGKLIVEDNKVPRGEAGDRRGKAKACRRVLRGCAFENIKEGNELYQKYKEVPWHQQPTEGRYARQQAVPEPKEFLMAKTVVQAPYRDTLPPTWNFVVSLARRICNQAQLEIKAAGQQPDTETEPDEV